MRAYQASVNEVDENDYNFEKKLEDYHDDFNFIDQFNYDYDTNDAYANEENYDSLDQSSHDVLNEAEANFVMSAANEDHLCNRCNKDFTSRNKLFQHLRNFCWYSELFNASIDDHDVINFALVHNSVNSEILALINNFTSSTNVEALFIEAIASSKFSIDASSERSAIAVTNYDDIINNASVVETSVIELTVASDQIKDADYEFKNWRYAIVWTRFAANDSLQYESCINIDYSAILTDKDFLLKRISDLQIQKLISFMSVREVNNKIIRTNEYALIKIFIDETVAIKAVTAVIIMKVHLVSDLKANILIDTDIIVSQELCINFKRQKLVIKLCKNLETAIQVMSRDRSYFQRKIKSSQSRIILSEATIEVFVSFYDRLLKDRDFLFESERVS